MEKVSQLIRLPRKYGELINTMSDEEAGKLIKDILGYRQVLVGLPQIYRTMIQVDLDNLENSAMNGGKGGRPKKSLRKELEDTMELLLEGIPNDVANMIRGKVKQRVREGKDTTEKVIKNIIETVIKNYE